MSPTGPFKPIFGFFNDPDIDYLQEKPVESIDDAAHPSKPPKKKKKKKKKKKAAVARSSGGSNY